MAPDHGRHALGDGLRHLPRAAGYPSSSAWAHLPRHARGARAGQRRRGGPRHRLDDRERDGCQGRGGVPMRFVLAIDPGPMESGLVLYDPEARRVIWGEVFPNEEAMRSFGWANVKGADVVVIEDMESYG